ncbi:MAG: hypothetical protein JXB62_07025 [Pirellulales bacterium]|nr:hypothetical protein [Pirellulales bacterium]
MQRTLSCLIALVVVMSSGGWACAARAWDGYLVVVSRATLGDSQWRKVADVLAERHHAEVVVFDESPDEALVTLRRRFPRYVCFLATPAEATRQFVADVHCLTRRLDDDPYTDVLWGILTGVDAGNALRIARHAEPLTIHRVAAGTEVELSMCDEGVWYCELNKNRMVRKAPGEAPRRLEGPDDTTQALVDALNVYRAQLFVTSGHATERDWQIGFRYRNGQFRSSAGGLFGVDTQGSRYAVESPNPKVYLPVGNCLMGHIDGPDAMALAWLHSAGVYQMIGYTVPTWYGYAGWGCLDYFLEQPGRFSLAEAFFANHQALLHRLATHFPSLVDAECPPGGRPGAPAEVSPQARQAGLSAHDGQGLLFDRDVLAFYGDPAWDARMAPGLLAWQQELREKDGVYTFEILPRRGERTFEPINTNGSQRGGRPLLQVLPHRVKNVEILEGQSLRPLVTDNFLLVPVPPGDGPKSQYRVVFRATRIDK